MAAVSQWPEIEPVQYTSVREAAKHLRSHCRKVVYHTLKHPFESPRCSYVRDMATQMNQFLTFYLEHANHNEGDYNFAYPMGEDETGDDEDDDEIEDVEEREGTIYDDAPRDWEGDDSAFTLTVPGVQHVGNVGSDPADNHAIHNLPTSSDFRVGPTLVERQPMETSALDFRIKIRWEGVSFPYKGQTNKYMYDSVENAIRTSGDPMIENLDIAGVEKRGVKDLDVHLWSVGDRKVLISRAASWLRRTKSGTNAVIMDDKFSVVIKYAQRELFDGTPSAIKAQLVQQNDHLMDGANIVYLGWLQGKPEPRESSDFLISFKDVGHANALIHSGVEMGGRMFVATRYRPNCNVIQCQKCFFFGHFAEGCKRPERCPCCSGDHSRFDCDILREKRRVFCANFLGAHAADSLVCPERKRLQSLAEYARQSMLNFLGCSNGRDESLSVKEENPDDYILTDHPTVIQSCNQRRSRKRRRFNHG